MKYHDMVTGATLLSTLCIYSEADAVPKARPNILLILSDDQGFCELGAYMDFADRNTLAAKRLEEWKKITECTPEQAPIEVCFEAARKCTPNLDRLAAEGTRFTSFYAAPTCAPSRAALMSARYPQRHGVYCNDDMEGQFGKGFPAEVPFPVDWFRQSGYRTGLAGKWHLGEGPGQHPNDRGFDYYFGFNRAHTEKYGSKILYRNRTNIPAEGWLEDQITEEALAFLKRTEEENLPFFLYVAYNVPHGPMPRPPQQYIDYINSGSDIVDVYFATIYGMDVGIGRMIKQLEELGQLENTLILFGSDNGQAFGSYHHGFSVRQQAYLVPVPGNGPLRGCKWTPWDGGVRVPFIARLPGGLKGQSSDSLQSITDVLPTALDYAAIGVPEFSRLDGRSFLSVLRNGQTSDLERTLFWACDSQVPFGRESWGPEYNDLQKRMQSLGQTKLRAEKYPPAYYVRTPRWKLIGWDAIQPALIDIANDPGERNDLSAQYPEVVKNLSAQFNLWMNEQAKPLVYPEMYWNTLRSIK